MRFYTHQHHFSCGIDLHARSMYVCILSHDGEIVLHRHMKAAPEAFLKAIAPIGTDWWSPWNASSPGIGSPISALKKIFPSSWDTPSI